MCKIVDLIHVTEDTTVVKTAMNFQGLLTMGNLLTSCATVTLYRKILLRGLLSVRAMANCK